MDSAGLKNANPSLIKDIKDPEYPISLEELGVIKEDAVEVDNKQNNVRVTFTPPVVHCEMAYAMGLCLRVKLTRSLPPQYQVDVRVAPGSHKTEAEVNEKLNTKECVAAALEDPALIDMLDKCLV
ncbi:Protein ae7 [Orobanche gracilis]